MTVVKIKKKIAQNEKTKEKNINLKIIKTVLRHLNLRIN